MLIGLTAVFGRGCKMWATRGPALQLSASVVNHKWHDKLAGFCQHWNMPFQPAPPLSKSSTRIDGAVEKVNGSATGHPASAHRA
jgi:hypothetical protein